MKFTFLGTSSAEGFPMAGCTCANCEDARQRSSLLVRKCALGLVNDDLLLDFGPDVMEACAVHGVSQARVRYCLITHAHSDHLHLPNFIHRSVGNGGAAAPRLHLYASRAVAEYTTSGLRSLLTADDFTANADGSWASERLNLTVHGVAAFSSFTVGAYRVTAFPANHPTPHQPLVYAVAGGGRAIFYGVDTAELPEAVWCAFHERRLRFDLVALDHTYGPDTIKTDHLNPRTFAAHVARLRDEGLLAADARIFAHHLAHEPHPPRARLASAAVAHDYEVPHDGLSVVLPRRRGRPVSSPLQSSSAR